MACTTQFRFPLFIEASHQNLDEIGFALNGESEFGVSKSVHCPGGVGISVSRFRRFSVGGAGTDGSSTEKDFGPAGGDDGTSRVQDFKDSRGVGDLRNDVSFHRCIMISYCRSIYQHPLIVSDIGLCCCTLSYF